MKAHLLDRDHDIDLQRPLPWNAEALTKDLALDTLFNAMAQGDKFVFEVVRKVVLRSLQNEVETIRYRQKVLQDCLNHPVIVRELYALAVEAVEAEKKHYFSLFMHYPEGVLRRSAELLDALLGVLKKLRKIADTHGHEFSSEGWTGLFATLQRELSNEYFAIVEDHLEQLQFRDGVLLSAKLTEGNKAGGYTLHAFGLVRYGRWAWLKRLLSGKWLRRIISREWRKWPFAENWLTHRNGERPSVLEFSLHPRDEGGSRILAQLRDRGVGLVANAVGQSTDHVRSFFSMLRAELAFYVGCVNLHEQLVRKGEPTCFPDPVTAEGGRLSVGGLYDVCLSLSMNQRVVGNDANANNKDLIVVTGANQGGKSTFLRSVGLAQLMMQCGMFAPAESFSSSVHDGLFTHYRREEDTSMKSGKLDEELSRMSGILDHITSYPMILFNESFAATNEREGSEIARQIVSALLDRGVKVVLVTHLYELARNFYENNAGNVLFLRAERQDGGVRTFKLIEGKPLDTSFGEDLYKSIFIELR